MRVAPERMFVRCSATSFGSRSGRAALLPLLLSAEVVGLIQVMLHETSRAAHYARNAAICPKAPADVQYVLRTFVPCTSWPATASETRAKIHMLVDLQGTRLDLRCIRLWVAYCLWTPGMGTITEALGSSTPHHHILRGHESSFAGCEMY